MQAIVHELTALGAKPPHISRVIAAWLSGEALERAGSHAHLPLSAALQAALPAIQAKLDGIVHVASEHPAEDGGSRLLLRLADGRTIESVLLPNDGLCVSSQIGCAVGCTFCMTGIGGLERQLSSAEILAQVVAGRRRQTLRRVVFMGMGEPAQNLRAVLEAMNLLGREGGFAHKSLVFSTVGEPGVFHQLARNEVKPALALSLHTTFAQRRSELLPRAPRTPPRELLDAAIEYAEKTRHPLQLQWTLLAGVNDGDEELDRLTAWLRGRRVVVNFIPYNSVPGLDHQRTSRARAHVMTRTLHRAGIHAKLRASAAQDVEGGCGQLRARAVENG